MIWLSLGRLYRREEQKSEEYEGTEEETVSPDREREKERNEGRLQVSLGWSWVTSTASGKREEEGERNERKNIEGGILRGFLRVRQKE